jgi:hypothetical protein
MSKNLVVFLDTVQRTIIGEVVDCDDDDILKIKNPVVVNIVPMMDPQTKQPNGNMSLQLIPIFFKEFQAVREEPVFFNYHRKDITAIDPFEHGFDFKMLGQYDNIFNPQIAVQPPQGVVPPSQPQATPPNTIKLFEDD